MPPMADYKVILEKSEYCGTGGMTLPFGLVKTEKAFWSAARASSTHFQQAPLHLMQVSFFVHH